MKTNPANWTTLVTGGCGYMGRQLCLRLLALGHNVWVVDTLSSGIHPDVWLKEAISERRTEAGRIIYRVGQKASPEAPTLTFVHSDLTGLLRGPQAGPAGPGERFWPVWFAAVFHLAAPSPEGANSAQDLGCVARRVAMDGQFFTWAASHKAAIERLVYVSPKDIHAATQALGIAADAGERMARLMSQETKVPTACVRLSHVYGKDQAAGQLLPSIAHQVLRAHNEVRLPQGSGLERDFLHVDDAVAALLVASEHGGDGQVQTLGSGAHVGLHEVAQRLVRLHNRPLTVTPPQEGPRPGQADSRQTVRGAAALGFAPKIALDDGLGQVLRTAERREQLKARAAQAPLSHHT